MGTMADIAVVHGERAQAQAAINAAIGELRLETQQQRIARFLGFVLSRHRLELYGICTDCREGRPSKRPGKGVQ